MNFKKYFSAVLIMSFTYLNAGVTFSEFWISKPPFIQGKKDGFDAQFKIKNNGARVNIEETAVAFHRNGTYVAGCWQRTINKILNTNEKHHATIGKCTISLNPGTYQVVAKVFYGGGWYDSANTYDITVNSPVNNPPTLTEEQAPPTEITVGDTVTLKLSAHDSDGDLGSIEVDWEGDSLYVTSKPANNKDIITFSRQFNNTGTFTITSTAYDTDPTVYSKIKRWTVKVNPQSNVEAPTFQTSFSAQDNMVSATLFYITKPEDAYYFDYKIYKSDDNQNPISSPVGIKTLLSGSFINWDFSIETLPGGEYEVVFGVYLENSQDTMITSVTKSFSKTTTNLPAITSISPNPLVAKNEYQDIYLNGSNFKNTNTVEWENDGEDGEIRNGTGFHFESANKIRLYMRTMTGGTGTWRFRVRDGSNYSDWISAEAYLEGNGEDTQKPTITILREENDIPKTGSLSILVRVEDNVALQDITITSDGTMDNSILTGTKVEDYVNVDISAVPSGNQVITMQAKDKAGNLSDVETFHYIKGTENYSNSILKNCSEVNNNYPYNCIQETSNFTLNDNIYSWVELRDLTNGTHSLRWKFIHAASNTTEENTVNLVWDDYDWMKEWTPLNNKKSGHWDVVVYLDGNKINQTSFLINDDTPIETIKLHTLTTSPQNAKPNTEIVFKATLNENIPNELYRVYLQIDGQSTIHEMDCINKECTFPQVIKSAGVNRKFTCTLKKGNTVLSSKDGYYTIVEDFSVSEVLPKFLDTDSRNHVVTIKGNGFTRSSKVYLKQGSGSWHKLNSTQFITSNELRVTVIPTEAKKGNWYFYVQNGSQKSNENNYIVVKQNEAPVLTLSSGTKEAQQGNTVSLSLDAYDNDGNVKQIDVNWGDGSVVSSSPTTSKIFTHTYNDYETYSWSSTAYDNEMKPSNRVTGKVLVYDSEYTQTPFVSQIYSLDGNSYLSASTRGQFLKIKGSNFSRVSGIEIIRPNGSRSFVLNSCTFSGGKKCIKYVSSSEIGVNLKFDAGDVGQWKFAVKNRDGISNYETIEVKQINVQPILIPNILYPSGIQMLTGTTKNFTLRAIDNNLKYIKMVVGGQTYDTKYPQSDEKVTFTYTAPNVTVPTVRTIWFKAKDNEGEYSPSISIQIAIYPNTVENKTYIDSEEVSKSNLGISVNCSVNTATGAESFSLPLLTVQGLHRISSVITYNSLLLTNGDLSKGWSHNYDVSAKLDISDDDKIRVNWNDGRYNDFEKSSATKYISKERNTLYDIIEKTVEGYSLIRKNRISYKFYENGYLQEISNYLDQKMLIGFDVNGKLSKVEDVTANLKLLYTYNENGKLSKVIDPQLNREVIFSYDAQNQLSSVETASGLYYFIYNDLGQMTEFKLENGTVFKNTYHSDGRVSTEDDGDDSNEVFEYSFEEIEENGIKKIKSIYKDGMGVSTTFIYDAKDFLLYKATDAKGNSVTNTYSPTTRALIESSNAKGQKTKLTYDANGNILSQTLPNGLVTHYSYDSNRNLLEEKMTLTNGTVLSSKYVYNANHTLKSKTLPNGDSLKYEYNSDNQIIKSLSPLNHATTYAYEKGRVSKVTYPKGNYVTYVYDEAGRLTTETIMPLDATTHYTYDEADRVTKVTDAMNHEVFVSYNQKGQKTSTTDAMGNVAYYRYDGNGNLVKTIYTDDTETTYSYDGEDRVTTITYANGASNKFEYDALGRVIKQIDAMGNFVRFEYDALGNVLQKFDVDGNLIAKYKYDSMQKVVEAVDYFNNKVSNSYNQLGMLEQTTDPLGRLNKFKYDKLGRLTEAVDALNGISTQSYDAEGNTKDFTDPNENKTELKHDKVGNLTEIKTASGSATKYEYDTNGLLIKETNARGQSRTYTYNKNGQVKTIVDDVGTITYVYDANGNTLSINENGKKALFVYDNMNRLTSYTDTEGNTIGYEYDSVGNLKTLTYPDGKRVEYGYNLANQLISVKDWNNNITSYEYDNHGRMVKQTYANGAVLTKSYDAGGRLISVKEFGGAFHRISEYAYEYDKVGNILKEKTYPQISPKELASFQMSYAKGNLLKEANQTVPTFDKDDNMLNFGSLALSYDSRNRLTKANGVSYLYDSQNNRLSKTVDGKKTSYTTNPNAPLSQLLVKTDADGSKTYYVYGLGLISQTKGSETLYYHYDLRGSTIALSKKVDGRPSITDTFSYAPYGKLLSRTGSTKTAFLFVGKHGVMAEENELVYMRARYYHESLRRFVNRDTLIGEVGDFGSLNRFGYVEGLVSSNIDPTGLTRTSMISEALISDDDLQLTINYACVNPSTRSDYKCFKLKASYVVMEACFGTAELLFGGGSGAGAKGGGIVIKNAVQTGAKETFKQSQKKINKEVYNSLRKIGKDDLALPYKYSRPSFSKDMRKKVYELSKDKNGKVLDPLTKKEIKYSDKFDLGHKPGKEYKKSWDDYYNKGKISKKQFMSEYKNSSHYRIETVNTNRSHQLELK